MTNRVETQAATSTPALNWIVTVERDITWQRVNATANAANTTLLGGCG
jgi:O-acetyl-ADP-ribose deacetylase (regulator of RNase III)